MGHKGRGCKSQYSQPKARKACKQHKPSSKVSCLELAPPAKKKKCSFDPGKATGNKGSKGGKWKSKSGTTRKLMTIGGLVVIVLAAFFVYTLIRGMGFAKEQGAQLQQLAPLLLA